MMTDRPIDATMHFKFSSLPQDAAGILNHVSQALTEKGYNPIQQRVGYLVTGEPAYITSHNQARTLIRSLSRDELLEELVRNYLKEHPSL